MTSGNAPNDLLAVFGYGSLINPASIARTLGRSLSSDELFVTRLQGFRRVWNLVDTVVDAAGAPRRAVFLNVEKDAATAVNGVCFHLSAEELAGFDARERNYDRIEVSDSIRPRMAGTVYTYVAKADHRVRDRDVCVLGNYSAIIEEGLLHWGAEFAHSFHATTCEHAFDRVEGAYSFAPPARD